MLCVLGVELGETRVMPVVLAAQGIVRKIVVASPKLMSETGTLEDDWLWREKTSSHTMEIGDFHGMKPKKFPIRKIPIERVECKLRTVEKSPRMYKNT